MSRQQCRVFFLTSPRLSELMSFLRHQDRRGDKTKHIFRAREKIPARKQPRDRARGRQSHEKAMTKGNARGGREIIACRGAGKDGHFFYLDAGRAVRENFPQQIFGRADRKIALNVRQR